MQVIESKGELGSLDDIFNRYLELEKIEVEAGFITPKRHPKSELNMVEIATIQQFGSIKQNIPERPFMTDGFILSEWELQKHLPAAIKEYLKGTPATTALEPIARVSRESIAKAIALQRFKPLAPTTLKLRREKGNTSSLILIDTGYLINGIESKISNK